MRELQLKTELAMRRTCQRENGRKRPKIKHREILYGGQKMKDIKGVNIWENETRKKNIQEELNGKSCGSEDGQRIQQKVWVLVIYKNNIFALGFCFRMGQNPFKWDPYFI